MVLRAKVAVPANLLAIQTGKRDHRSQSPKAADCHNDPDNLADRVTATRSHGKFLVAKGMKVKTNFARRRPGSPVRPDCFYTFFGRQSPLLGDLAPLWSGE